MGNKIFTVTAKHWWDYLNPLWWRRKRVAEAVFNYSWDKYGMKERMDSAIRHAVLFGQGAISVDFDNHQHAWDGCDCINPKECNCYCHHRCPKCRMLLLWPLEKERHKCPEHKPSGRGMG